MAVVQVNPPGTAVTTEGYVSSITVRTGGSAQALRLMQPPARLQLVLLQQLS